MPCRRAAVQLRRTNEVLASLGAQVVAFGPGDAKTGDHIRAKLRLPFPVIADTNRTVYRLFGFRLRAGGIQECGTVVIDRKGVIGHIHRTVNFFDAVRLDTLLPLIETLQ